MSRLRLVFISVFVGLGLLIIYHAGQNLFAGPKTQVRRFILQGCKAYESAHVLALAEMISLNYEDRYGYDRSSLLFLLRQIFQEYPKNFVVIRRMDIQVKESQDEAIVDLYATAAGIRSDGERKNILEGEKGRARCRLVREDGRWRLREIEFYEPDALAGQDVS